MEETELQNELASIRSIMERSSKFISLSGLSGILAGVYALIGAGAAYLLILNANLFSNAQYTVFTDSSGIHNFIIDYSSLVWQLSSIAMAVLLASITTAILLSKRQARRKNQPIWGRISRQLIFHMAVPLLAGGGLIVGLIFDSHLFYIQVAPVCLIFYGLALVSASNFTFPMVKYLGLCEIALGLIAACVPGYGLLFWALGFGVLHIIYGGMMYLKYDR